MIENKIIASMLDRVAPVIAKKSTLPIVQCVKIECDKGKVRLSATNLEINVCITEDTISEDTFQFVVDFALLRQVVKNAVLPALKYEVNGNHVKIVDDSIFHKLPIEDIEDFPELDFTPQKETYSISNGVIKSFPSMIHAKGNDELHQEFDGICLLENGKSVCTDGFRLYLNGNKWNENEELPKILLPSNIVKILSHSEEEEIELSCTNENVYLETDTMKVTFKNNYSSNFPDVSFLTGIDKPNSFKIERKLIINALRVIGYACDSVTKRVLFSLSEGKLTMETRNEELNLNARITIGITNAYEYLTGFNLSYLESMVNNLSSDFLKFTFTPNVNRGQSGFSIVSDSQNYEYVLMPVQVAQKEEEAKEVEPEPTPEPETPTETPTETPEEDINTIRLEERKKENEQAEENMKKIDEALEVKEEEAKEEEAKEEEAKEVTLEIV
jgi:DNA polymerase-3 subunit beta